MRQENASAANMSTSTAGDACAAAATAAVASLEEGLAFTASAPASFSAARMRTPAREAAAAIAAAAGERTTAASAHRTEAGRTEAVSRSAFVGEERPASSSSCTLPSPNSVSWPAAASRSDDARPVPYVFGCTYTTGSSVPAFFSPAVRASSSASSGSSSAASLAAYAPSTLGDGSSGFVADLFRTSRAASSSPRAGSSQQPSSNCSSSCGDDKEEASCPSNATFCGESPHTTATAATATAAAAGVEGPACAIEAVLQESAPVPAEAIVASGWNFEEEVTLNSFLSKCLSCGFQATQLGRAILEVQRMQQWRLSQEPVAAADVGSEWECLEKRRETRCCIWLSFTSNMISSGLREVFLFLCKHRFVDVVVTSAGGVEEDFVKALAPTIIGDFCLSGKQLREKGWNRIGNLLVPNHNYCLFEDWLQPVLDRMLEEQQERLCQAFHDCMQEQRETFSTLRRQHGETNAKDDEAKAKHQAATNKKKASNKPHPQQEGRVQQEVGLQQQQQQEEEAAQQAARGQKADCSANKGEASEGRKRRSELEEEEEEEEKTDAEEEEEKGAPASLLWSSVERKCLLEAMAAAAWSPSEVISRLGKEINNEGSVFYWCWRNGIPVFCPGLTDGSLGDNLFFHSYRKKGLVIDIVKDIRRINDIALKCRKSGMLILGGGLPKHHTCNANLMRNGADFAVYINTGVEYDGSDSGARPDEAISWGKIAPEAKPVKVYGEATILFPLLVAATFAKEFHQSKRSAEKPPSEERLSHAR